MVETRLLKNFDWWIFFATLGLIGFGCLMIYSASMGNAMSISYIERQLVWAAIGLICAIFVASIDTSFYHRHTSKLYIITIIMLILVLVIGDSSKGAQRWIGYGSLRIQPSEFAKITMIVAMSVFVVTRLRTIRTIKTFLLSLVYFMVPMLLIFKQPDLGTSLVLIAIWMTILFIMGTDLKNIGLFILAGIVLFSAGWTIPGIMKDYQKKRIITFLNPSVDPTGSGYHVTQSRIAIGSGQLYGKGYLQGTQRKLQFIPEQHTDFIFTVVGEEMGFVGASFVLLLYFIILWRAVVIMLTTEDTTGRAITAGVVGMFVFHIFVNIGMTLGIMPVTGVPLPFMSYGGSALLANLLAIGLLEGVSLRRHRINF
ncbi:MAG: rod shape-determining protein RodA [Armatimonadota bacterium]